MWGGGGRGVGEPHIGSIKNELSFLCLGQFSLLELSFGVELGLKLFNMLSKPDLSQLLLSILVPISVVQTPVCRLRHEEGVLSCPHRWEYKPLISLYDFGQSSPHELIFRVELDPRLISLTSTDRHPRVRSPVLLSISE